MKYKNGTKIKYVGNYTPRFSAGEVFEIIESPDYPEAYDIVGQPSAGWIHEYIENTGEFEVIKENNIDWKKELGG